MTTIGPPKEWVETLDQHRAWVRGCITSEATGATFDVDWAAKVNVIATIANGLSPNNTRAWQALGVVFGDALALITGLPWGEVTDEHGTDPGIIANAATNAVVFPMTMLSRRAEEGHPPDRDAIFTLFRQVALRCQQLAGE